VQCTVYSVQCAVYSVQCTMYSVQCAVCSVQCAVCSVQCAVYSVVGSDVGLLCRTYIYFALLNLSVLHNLTSSPFEILCHCIFKGIYISNLHRYQ
jgi:hypothetical protein